MKRLEDFTAGQVIDYLANKEAERLNISKSLAKKLVINAITYNVVVEEIENQIDFLIEEDE